MGGRGRGRGRVEELQIGACQEYVLEAGTFIQGFLLK